MQQGKKIEQLCDDSLLYNTASICIPPGYVRMANEYLRGGRKAICTVVGFPNGYNTTEIKIAEAVDAVNNGGANEIDMVINIGMLRDGRYDDVEGEIKAIRAACPPKVILKVIIEACLLTHEEKLKMCEIVTNSGADYIKTSTGFSTHGATPEDVALLKKNVGPNVKVKAAGGISSIDDAKEFIELGGAARLGGTSRIIQILKEQATEDSVGNY